VKKSLLLLIASFLFIFCDGLWAQKRTTDVAKPTLLVDSNNKPLPDDPNDPRVGWETLEAKSENKQWMGVGQLLRDGKPGCSAVVIKPPQCARPETQKVQVLTNGHCTGAESKRKFSLRFGMFKGTSAKDHAEISAHPIYSSENQKDLGILELDVNYKDLSRFGITPFEIGSAFNTSEELQSVGIPLQGVNEENQVLHKNSHCQAESPVTIIDQFRYFTNEYPMNKCSIVGGNSGSGIFNKEHQLVGLMNAGTLGQKPEPPSHECELDTCVYDGNGAPHRKDANFGFDVTSLNDCYKNCKLDTTLPKCRLPDSGSLISVGPTGKNENWTSDLKHRKAFALKNGNGLQVKGCTEASSCSCQNASGYQTLPKEKIISFQGEFNAVFSPADYFPGRKTTVDKGQMQFQFLCLRARKADGQWEPLKNATAFPLYLHKEDSGSLGSVFSK
jgi:V8-like Glu-specific endopeptidase